MLINDNDGLLAYLAERAEELTRAALNSGSNAQPIMREALELLAIRASILERRLDMTELENQLQFPFTAQKAA